MSRFELILGRAYAPEAIEEYGECDNSALLEVISMLLDDPVPTFNRYKLALKAADVP